MTAGPLSNQWASGRAHAARGPWSIRQNGETMKDEDNETYKEAREILELAKEMHRKLSEFYQSRKGGFKDERVNMLMQYMQRHEKQMQEVLTETLAVTPDKVLDTYYQFEPSEVEVLLEVQNWQIGPDAGLDDIIDRVMRFDEILRNYYSRAADMATSEQVADVFRNLKSREEENRNSKVQDALLLKDL
jgi:hypothetical protein